ncbi:Amidoligase family protein [Sulfidibacter corallicola]|uniref:Amidoligase family protein n=1 Tax=Sulfidibacter corallicola TaxID=2818388 RepID=A0A8A4TY83_SULCO|nr:amidoligase family protein [Sulfidibacter corallicola]QTD54178.1 amidoligase family protein [Sulfidibacter corallicola]
MDMREFKFGIEIECFGRMRSEVAKRIQTVVGGTARPIGGWYDETSSWVVDDRQRRTWKIVNDSSINATHGQKIEIVSPILTYTDIPQLQEVVRAVRRLGCKVNDTTGIHIHVDKTIFTAKTLTNFVKIFYKQEALLFEALQVQPQRELNYCKSTTDYLIDRLNQVKPKTLQELSDIWYEQYPNQRRNTKYHSSRYRALNVHAALTGPTIECRIFNSTLHAGKVKAYVQLVLAMAAKAANSRSARADQRPFNPESAKFDFRCFLLNLGLIGEEFATARLHLLKHLPGDAAFKKGRKSRPARAA